MIQISGSQLSQWDVGRSVCVSDSNATHVHFANQGDSKAPIIKIENGEAKIPDYLLQTGKALNAYAVLDGVTLESRSFAVRKRARPENYVYEDDQRNYIYDLITNAEDAAKNANLAAQKANEAAEKIGSVVIPTKVSQLQNDSGFLTEVPVTTTKVSLTEQPDGSYLSSLTAAEIMADYKANKTVHCYHDKMILPLIHSVITTAVFSGIYDGQIQIVTVDSNKVATVTATPISSGGADGLLFDQTAGMLYLTKDGQITGTGVQLPTAEGGPTNNAVLTVENTSGWAEKTVANDAECMISFHWSSTEGGVSTGSGTLMLKVNQALKYSSAIAQGGHALDISQYLSLGENLVHVSVTDFYGNSQYITFGLNVYDPATLKSPKLVERTLTGDYTNDRVTKVFSDAFHGLTLDRLELPNVTELDARAFAGCKANELVLASFTTLNGYPFWDCDIGVVKLPSVVEAGDRCLFSSKIGRIIFNSLETLGTPVRVFADIKIFDFHKLTSLWDLIPKNDPAYSLIIRTPTVCALQSEATDTKATLYVPSALVADYKAATNWSAMADRIFAIEEHPEVCEVNENV